MQRTLLEYLVCPTCQGSLELQVFSEEADEILEGSLICTDCRAYPIRGGIPRMVPPDLREVVLETGKAFGWQWKQFANLLLWDQQREQFFDWLQPLTPADFHNKVVLDAGCGMGRLTEVAATCGPKALIGVDLSEAVDVAWRRLRGRPNVHVVQGDMLRLPLRRGPKAQLDLAYSIGVLHHMPDPRAGTHAVLDTIRVGGRMQGWVYGKEGNAWIEHGVSPIRRYFTSRMPRHALLGLSYALTAPLHAAAVAKARFDVPGIPYGDYLAWLGRYPFGHTHHVVFDHLGPPVSHYVSHEELEEWLSREGVRALQITSRNNNSWRFLAERTAVPD